MYVLSCILHLYLLLAGGQHDILQEAMSVDYKQATVIVVHSCGCSTIQGYLGDDMVACLVADVQRHSGALPRMWEACHKQPLLGSLSPRS